MMSNLATRFSGKADGPVNVGSTIPRAVRMGTKFTPAPTVSFPVESINTRDSKRLVPRKTRTVLTLTTDKRLDARIVNLSSQAVAVEADLSSIHPSQVKMVGARPVRPGRRIALGAVFLFCKPIPNEICNENLVL